MTDTKKYPFLRENKSILEALTTPGADTSVEVNGLIERFKEKSDQVRKNGHANTPGIKVEKCEIKDKLSLFIKKHQA
jgi:hypothetical protein